MTPRFNRRSMLRGLLGGSAVCMGIPALDIFLNANGNAWADGAKLPVRFGTYFWGLGLTDTPTGGTRWVPTKQGAGYELTPELQSLAKVKDKVSVFSGFRAIGGGEIPEFTKPLSQSRSEAMARMVEEAKALGSTAIVAMRFDSGAIGQWSEICAYGTAAVITPLTAPAG